MRRLLRSRSLTLMLLIPSLGALAASALLGTASVYSISEDTDALGAAVSLDGGNAEAAYRLARLRHLGMTGNENETERLYFDSLAENPLLSASWLGLAELYIDSDRDGEARIALGMAQGLIPSSIGLLWESSMLAFRLGDTGLALGNLRVVAAADGSRRKRAFDMCWQVTGDPALILDRAVDDDVLPEYLRYLIYTDRMHATYPAWEKLVRSGTVPDAAAVTYAEYLIGKGDVGTAELVWDSVYPEGGGPLVWNGGFERDTAGKGFDWRIYEEDGVETEYDYRSRTEGERSLRVGFTGEKNLDFRNVRQVVPVEPGSRYLLTWDIATSDITTRNGITMEVYCRELYAVSENYTGSSDWTGGRIVFVAPEECGAVNLRLRRKKSSRLDNLLSGEVWLDNVRMQKLGRADGA